MASRSRVAVLPLLLCLASHLIDAVTFDQQPSDREVIEGGLVILSCAVTDIGNANVYWRFIDDTGAFTVLTENRNVDKYAFIHGELSRKLSISGDPAHGEYNLRIKNFGMENQGSYVCSVISSDGDAYDSNRASIIIRPTHQVIPETHNPLPACLMQAITIPGVINVDLMVRLTCALPSGTPKQTLRWTRVGTHREELVSCPGSPCVYNRQLTIQDVNTTFACELVGGTSGQERVECTHIPLPITVGVVVDPPESKVPTGESQDFVCFSINYDFNNLLFQWYNQSELIPNGNSMSLNLPISRELAGSKLSCVVSTRDGNFQGIGQALISPFDPRDILPDIEGSSSPVISQRIFESVTNGRPFSLDSLNQGTYLPTRIPSKDPGLVLKPIRQNTSKEDSSSHPLPILVVVSAIAGALVTLLVCAVSLCVVLFVRRRQKDELTVHQDISLPEKDLSSGRFEMKHVKIDNEGDMAEYGLYNEIKERECEEPCAETDMCYATLDPDSEEQYADGTMCTRAKDDEVFLPEAQSPIAPPCTPNDYARPQANPVSVDNTDRLNHGRINDCFLRSHERNMSDSSASAYAVTELVSHKGSGRFVFKGMTGRDEADIGVCSKRASIDGPATLARVPARTQTAPPLPARTLPRNFSSPDVKGPDVESFSERRLTDSEAKDNLKNKIKTGRNWIWSGKTRSSSKSTKTESAEGNSPDKESDVTPPTAGIDVIGDYAEILSYKNSRDHCKTSVESTSKQDGGATNRHSTSGSPLGCIPERSAGTLPVDDLDAYATAATIPRRSANRERDPPAENTYDKLTRPTFIVSPKPEGMSTKMPVYAKVQKSKSLDHGGKAKSNWPKVNRQSVGREDSNRSPSGSTLARSMSEGTAPPSISRADSYGGYETVTKSSKLDSILVQIRNGFPGQTLDVPEGMGGGPGKGMSTGGHFAKIV